MVEKFISGIVGLAKTFVFLLGVGVLGSLAIDYVTQEPAVLTEIATDSADKKLEDAVEAFLAIPKGGVGVSPAAMSDMTVENIAGWYIEGFETRGNKATPKQRDIVYTEVAPRLRTLLERVILKHTIQHPDATDAEIAAIIETDGQESIQQHTLGVVGLLLR